MTRRDLALQVMRTNGSTEETITQTLEMFDFICAQDGTDGQKFLDSEVTSAEEEEYVKRLFAMHPSRQDTDAN